MPDTFTRQDHGQHPLTGGEYIVYSDPVDRQFLIKSEQLSRLVNLPDLTRKDNSPIKFITDQILKIPEFKDFDVLTTPETITIESSFDLFNTPQDHPSRKPTDTYFLNQDRILRTQTTTMWFYYLNDQKVRTTLENDGCIRALCHGKVYRKDEIDKSHFPVFHQIDGLYISRKGSEKITLETLQNVLSGIIKSTLGHDIEFRFLEDKFPFTDPSTQIEIKSTNGWLEVVGGGLVHRNVLKNFNLDPEIYNGWAFGFGLERLAMIKNKISDIRVFWSDDLRITRQFTDINSQFKEVSKFPPAIRDISFIVGENFVSNNYFDLIRDVGGNLVEEVKVLDNYLSEEKFGKNKASYTFRIVYRSLEKTLTNEEVNVLHSNIEEATTSKFGAEIRKT